MSEEKHGHKITGNLIRLIRTLATALGEKNLNELVSEELKNKAGLEWARGLHQKIYPEIESDIDVFEKTGVLGEHAAQVVDMFWLAISFDINHPDRYSIMSDKAIKYEYLNFLADMEKAARE